MCCAFLSLLCFLGWLTENLGRKMLHTLMPTTFWTKRPIKEKHQGINKIRVVFWYDHSAMQQNIW